MVCQLSPACAQGGSGVNTLIGVLLLCHEVSAKCNIRICLIHIILLLIVGLKHYIIMEVSRALN